MRQDFKKLAAAKVAATILTAPVYIVLAFVFTQLDPISWPIFGRAILGGVWLTWFLIGHYQIANDDQSTGS